MLFPQIEEIYGRAGVPLLSTKSNPRDKEKIVCNKLVKILEQDKAFRKMPKANRTRDQLDDYSKALDKTCVLWPTDAFDQIKNDEDKCFLQSMIEGRKATIG